MKKKKIISFLTVLLLTFSISLNAKGIISLAQMDSLPKYEQVRLLSKLCWENRESHTQQALEYGLQGIKIAKEAGYEKSLAELYNYVGVIYQHYLFDTRKGMYYYDLGLPLSLKLKDSVEIGYVYNNLGDAFYTIGNVPLAFEYGKKSLQIFNRLHNTQGIAYGYINMGEANRIDRRYDSALYYFQKAIRLRRKIGDSIGVASATLEVARTLFLMGNIDKAKQYFKESLRKHEYTNNKNYMAYSMQGMGDVYLVNHKYDSAYIYYNEAFKLCKERNNPTGEINSLLSISKVLAHRGEKVKGQKILDQAMSIAEKSQLIPNILKVYKAKGEFYQHLKEYKNSSDNYRCYIHAYDSLFSNLQFQTLNQIKDRFKIAEQLSFANRNLKERKRNQLYGIFMILILILFIVILFYRNRKIEQLSTELLESNKTKDKIFSIISHDLVSPFNVLLGASELLLEDLKNKAVEDAQKKAQLIHRTADETFRFITNLLNWSRAQRKNINVNKESFDIVKLLHEVKRTLIHQAELKNIKVEVTGPENVNVIADRNLIQIVLMNLLNNALKFTHENGKVLLTIEKQSNGVKVSVIDNGTGISEDRLSKIFSSAEIESTRGTKNEKGTGLGLIICKEFIEMHGSKLYIKSKEGKGTEFWFFLPEK